MDEFVRSEVFEARLQRVDDENNRQNHPIDRLETMLDKLNDLASSVQVLAQNMAQMKDELHRQGDRLDAIEKEPAEKWKKLVWLIVTGVAGAVVGFIVSKLGM